jgi:glycosyltransferase involved in cell wall biosynthesis
MDCEGEGQSALLELNPGALPVVVLQINKFFFEKGGAERYFFGVSHELERRGHTVVHFSMEHPRNRPSPQSHYFVPRRDYDENGARPSLRDAGRLIRSSDAADRVRRLAVELRPDVAHLHNVYHQLTPSIIDALRSAGVPVVMTLHDYKLVCPSYGLFSRGRFCYRCRGGRFYHAPLEACSGGSRVRSALLAVESYYQKYSGVYESVARFTAPSRFMQKTFLDAGYEEERVVYLPAFVPDEEGIAPSSASLPAGLPERFALYLGRLSPEKGVNTVLAAAALNPGIPTVICGAGPERERLQAEADAQGLDGVYFTGHADRAAVHALLERAAMALLPTLSPENAPFSALEAAVAGVPLVVSSMGGLPEIADLSGGRVVPVGDAAVLAGAIKDVWHSPGNGAADDGGQWRGRRRQRTHPCSLRP